MIEDRKVFIYKKFHGILSKILQTVCQTKRGLYINRHIRLFISVNNSYKNEFNLRIKYFHLLCSQINTK
jgi:hypothetical protein